jgi:YesN/AraC family two-component response regulator
MPTEPIRVLIADDERLARRGLRQLLTKELDLTIVAECETGEQVLTTLRQQTIDVLFLDVQMPLGDGFDV